jgi:hypothetical protein
MYPLHDLLGLGRGFLFWFVVWSFLVLVTLLLNHQGDFQSPQALHEHGFVELEWFSSHM